jgi:hypothetical protein
MSKFNHTYLTPLISALLGCLGITISVNYNNNKWQQALLDKGYAEYNNKTGHWQLCTHEQILFNTNSILSNEDGNKSKVTLENYARTLENELKDQRQTINNLEIQTFEQEKMLEKHRKVNEIPGKVSKTTWFFDVEDRIEAVNI